MNYLVFGALLQYNNKTKKKTTIETKQTLLKKTKINEVGRVYDTNFHHSVCRQVYLRKVFTVKGIIMVNIIKSCQI